MMIVKFEASREGKPIVQIDGKTSFPERFGVQPAVGEKWEVEISGQNPAGTVNFLQLLRRVEELFPGPLPAVPSGAPWVVPEEKEVVPATEGPATILVGV